MYLKFIRSSLTPRHNIETRDHWSSGWVLSVASGVPDPPRPANISRSDPPTLLIPSNTRHRTRKWGHAACTAIHLNSMTTTANKSFIHCLIYCLLGQKSCSWYEDRFTPCRWGPLKGFYCYRFPYQLVMCSLYQGAIKATNDWNNMEGPLSSQCQSNLRQFSHTFYFD